MKSAKTVLLVDDDENITRAFERFFTQENVQMESAINNEQAVALLTSGHFDLLIFNIGLNEFASLELLKLKKKLCPDIPTIVISAFPNVPYKWNLEAMGVSYFFAKPFDIVKLREAIEFVLYKKPNHRINQT